MDNTEKFTLLEVSCLQHRRCLKDSRGICIEGSGFHAGISAMGCEKLS